ncbi:unnamed protein product [Miscanthus lutarioriparius]|uniref:Late embryogenesis abundant protein LEA-2 subgroup domain-containing protein n=1 Tax=Miscanthus lutarioriparius TaxID=422564 RepID=A0A811NL34_9POAL|nr:unnamed protein product [Miscanthus lutarioriparius]
MASSSRREGTLTPDDPADVKTAGSAEWRPKHYVLAGMVIILAASTVTIVTSAVLRPARIQFSVANFTMSNADNAQMAIDFDLRAYNPSRRAGVIYRHVVVSNEHAAAKARAPEREEDIGARDCDGPLPLPQGRSANYRSMGVNGTIDNDFFSIYSNASSVSTTIMVIAQVQFKVGLVKSRLYSIRVLCSSIDKVHIRMPPANATCSA